jgi:hypothetical protein
MCVDAILLEYDNYALSIRAGEQMEIEGSGSISVNKGRLTVGISIGGLASVAASLITLLWGSPSHQPAPAYSQSGTEQVSSAAPSRLIGVQPDRAEYTYVDSSQPDFPERPRLSRSVVIDRVRSGNF